MSVRCDGDIVRLEGDCPVEDAETLTTMLQGRSRIVDVFACERLHAAVAQALLAFAPALASLPADGFLPDVLAPAVAHQRASRAGDRRVETI